MKRFHVHVAVKDLSESVRFYSTLFAAEPTVLKDDYAKWMLEDPGVNVAISSRGRAVGVDHLGIQVEDDTALKDMANRLQEAGRPVLKQGETVCCYARSDKVWITDLQGLAWETFYTLDEAPVYGEDRQSDISSGQIACCMPASSQRAVGCKPKEISPCCGSPI